MSGLIRCVAVCVVLAVLTCFVSLTVAGDDGGSAAGPVRIATAVAAPRAAGARVAAQLPKGALLGELRLRVPPPWSTPKLRSVIGVLRTDPKGQQLYTLSGSGEPAAESYAGSLGVMRPNDAGVYTVGGKVNLIVLNTTLRFDFTRAVQQEQNIGLVTALSRCTAAAFAVGCDAAGWYLVTLHLTNAAWGSSNVRNLIRRTDVVTHRYFTDLDDTRAVATGASLVLPMLVEVSGPNRQSISWEVESTDGNWVSLVLHAVTVDKIG
jgi:hypothetical protein